VKGVLESLFGAWRAKIGEFLGQNAILPYTGFAALMLVLVSLWWLRKPGLLGMLASILVILGLCGVPGLHSKNSLLYGAGFLNGLHRDLPPILRSQGMPIFFYRQ
jgi:glucan phosphoethanolaminetransferase (alkaline phosphatase superfamily)